MQKVMAIYTGTPLIEPIKKLSKSLTPGVEFINVLDDGMIKEVMKAEKMTKPVLRRIFGYCRNAEDMGVDAVFQTCSSVGESVDLIRPFFDFPILRIDEAMAEEAVNRAERIGVMGTLSSTLDPSSTLIEKKAREAGKKIEVINGLAQGAFEALSEGDRERHDNLILETARNLAGQCDLIVLAQGSMAGMKARLEEAAGLPVLTSVESGMLYLKKELDRL
jgi:Asp/Glu/hydantoin racemase